MTQSRVHFEWRQSAARQFRTGVSLHSHTVYSRETLAFIYRLAGRVPYIRWVLRRGEAEHLKRRRSQLDLTRAWWTPPCAPLHAWNLEKKQIEDRLQSHALVSITDHDTIEAPLVLRALESCRDVPISVEWTIPFSKTFFHLGVHNLPSEQGRRVFREMAQFTAEPDGAKLRDILRSLAQDPSVLIVFNHPCWDESGIGAELHFELATQFLRFHAECIHAFELNGLRPWSENRRAFSLARAWGKPVISGGDRHALEPNSILDLTNAATFAEYVEQVRSGFTDVLVTHHYRDPFRLRILRSLEEILQHYPDHGMGRYSWSDRAFYRCDDGATRSLAELFGRNVPAGVNLFVTSIGFLRHSGLERTFRFVLPRQQEFAL